MHSVVRRLSSDRIMCLTTLHVAIALICVFESGVARRQQINGVIIPDSRLEDATSTNVKMLHHVDHRAGFLTQHSISEVISAGRVVIERVVADPVFIRGIFAGLGIAVASALVCFSLQSTSFPGDAPQQTQRSAQHAAVWVASRVAVRAKRQRKLPASSAAAAGSVESEGSAEVSQQSSGSPSGSRLDQVDRRVSFAESEVGLAVASQATETYCLEDDTGSSSSINSEKEAADRQMTTRANFQRASVSTWYDENEGPALEAAVTATHSLREHEKGILAKSQGECPEREAVTNPSPQ